MQTHEIQCLLMGGQACILYGAAEFSRDTDFTVFASAENLTRLQHAFAALDASVVALPPFELPYLERGHSVHFRCRHPEADGIRVDLMTKMRGVDPFPQLWNRRTTFALPDGIAVDVLSLPDLVASKKTQRDKDWPMLVRLIEANYEQFFREPTPERIAFWLRELRTPELLVESGTRFPDAARALARERPAIQAALDGRAEAVHRLLTEEEASERALDRTYWAPLRAELEAMRHARRRETR
ncbi:MAG: hypothetical protein ABR559_08880 [Gemmatimonadota bacterium]